MRQDTNIIASIHSDNWWEIWRNKRHLLSSSSSSSSLASIPTLELWISRLTRFNFSNGALKWYMCKLKNDHRDNVCSELQSKSAQFFLLTIVNFQCACGCVYRKLDKKEFRCQIWQSENAMFDLLWFLVVAGELVGSKAKLVDECRRHLLHLVIVKSLRKTDLGGLFDTIWANLWSIKRGKSGVSEKKDNAKLRLHKLLRTEVNCKQTYKGLLRKCARRENHLRLEIRDMVRKERKKTRPDTRLISVADGWAGGV